MSWSNRLKTFENAGLLKQTLQHKIGLEKEALRVTGNGLPAQTAHPKSLGHKYTHPNITTDFAECQLELVTAPFPDSAAALTELKNIQAFTARNVGDEILWNHSMPGRLPDGAAFSIARYGNTNEAKIKELYRTGLATRYGYKMQAISGLHFNYSLGKGFWDVWTEHTKLSKTDAYLGLIRNFRRYGWLLSYLFGSTPAVDKSFYERDVGEIKTRELELLGNSTLIGPNAVSLRMSKLGYINASRCSTSVSYNSLPEYLSNIQRAITKDCKDFSKIGPDAHGQLTQLNGKILQIENEYYSIIRAKPPMKSKDRPLSALAKDGISYVEVRSVDIDPEEAIGIGTDQASFIELFLIYCLLKESPAITGNQDRELHWNQNRVGLHGLANPKLKLDGRFTPMLELAGQMFKEMHSLADYLERPTLKDAIHSQERKLVDPNSLPAVRILERLKREELEFHELAFIDSQANTSALQAVEMSAESIQRFTALAQKSLAEIEKLKKDTIPFGQYLDNFNSVFEEHPIVA